jgi:hypothetical protein
MEKLNLLPIEDWTDTYICESVIWTPDTQSNWSITKIDTDWKVMYPINPATWKPSSEFVFLPADATTYVYTYWRDTTVPTVSFTINEWDLTTESSEVTIEGTAADAVWVVRYNISETSQLDFNKFTNDEPTSFTLSEWLWVKTLYMWVVDWAGNYSARATTTIELV